MTVKDAYNSIVEDGINLGTSDFVELEALRTAAHVLEALIKGNLKKVVCGKYYIKPCGPIAVLACSICDAEIPFGMPPDKMKYCHRCGAKMSGEVSLNDSQTLQNR